MAKLVVLFGLLTAATALSYETDVRAGEPIDLNGDWTVMVEGDVTVKCTANVTQTGTDVQVLFRCPGVFQTELAGEVNQAGRTLSLGRGDSESLFAVDLTGVVADDGESVQGTWDWSDGDLVGTFVASRGLQPQPRPNIVGSWEFQVRAGTCDAELSDDGLIVQLNLQCPNSPPGAFTGNLEGRVLSLFDGDSEIATTVTADGLALAGYWLVREPCCDAGPLTGLKQMSKPFEDNATGDWRVSIESGILGSCDVAVDQSPANELFAAFDCGVAAAYWARGAIDPASATFELVGGIEPDVPLRLVIKGVVNAASDQFAATYELRQQQGGALLAGILSGQQLDDTPSFIDANGMNELHLNSILGDEVVCSFEVRQEFEVLSAKTHCPRVGDGTLTGWLSPLTGELSLLGDVGGVSLTLDGAIDDSRIFEGDWDSGQRFVSGCFTTSLDADCEQSRYVPGDANCDRRTNSLDAALVLQLSAGFLVHDDLPCPSNVFDLRHECCPVVLNALDAALILQINAGLLGRW